MSSSDKFSKTLSNQDSADASRISEGIIISGIESPQCESQRSRTIKSPKETEKTSREKKSLEYVTSSGKKEKRVAVKQKSVDKVGESVGNEENGAVNEVKNETTEKDKMVSSAGGHIEEEEAASVSTKRQFGVNKGVISRAVVKFSAIPEPQPLTACFHVQGVFLTHKQVLEVVRMTLAAAGLEKDGYTVTSIQFIDRNTIHGAQGMDNRWLISFDDPEAKRLLIHQGLSLYNRKVAVREYDDILRDEYNEYLEYKQHQNKLFARDEKNEEKLETKAEEKLEEFFEESTAEDDPDLIARDNTAEESFDQIFSENKRNNRGFTAKNDYVDNDINNTN